MLENYMRSSKQTFPLEVRESVFQKNCFQCENSLHAKCLGNVGLSIHHIISNTKLNARLYGDKFLQSEDNAMLLCYYCHDHQAEMPRVKERKQKLLESLR